MMKIQLVSVDRTPAICEICQTPRPHLDAIEVHKTLNGDTPVLVDFVICGVCAIKIALVTLRAELARRQAVAGVDLDPAVEPS